MKIAIVGSGISGLVCSWLLQREHEVAVYEAGPYAGGHTNTVDVELDGQSFAVDTGFIVFNDWTYPNFIRLLDRLGVPSVPSPMSFSVRCDRCGLEYGGSSLKTLFAQPGSLRKPSHWRMLADILRFNHQAPRLLHRLDEQTTIGEFLRQHRYSRTFAEHYLLPMGAAVWSCATAVFEQFPVRFLIEFFQNHGLLNLKHRPVWRTIRGGARTYVDAMLRGFRGTVRLSDAVRQITRHPDSVEISSNRGTASFDEVVLACHSDQALALLANPTPTEQEILSQFPYSSNTAVLHTDKSVLPSCRAAWSSWNYHVPAGDEQRPCVTYNMNLLQHLPTQQTVCVTLNPHQPVEPHRVLRRFAYSHPVFRAGRGAAQARHAELIRNCRTSYCGAWWGNGFHEDGVNSALAVCADYGLGLDGRIPGVLPVAGSTVQDNNSSVCRVKARAGIA